jgi:uncharacterized protein with NRDE domain
MCLLLLALNVVPKRPWLLLGNRDEFHERATSAAAAWTDHSDVIGGRDLVAGGSWLALHRNGRFAAVTNVRIGSPKTGAFSRGDLVAEFVTGEQSAGEYVVEIASRVEQYGPFNVIVGDHDSVWGISSIDGKPWRFKSGTHVLSNGPPTENWPKMQRIRERFEATIRDTQQNDPKIDEKLLDLLLDTQAPSDDELPQTGVGIDIERTLSPIFIRGATYGTRASTLAYAKADGGLVLAERGFGPEGVRTSDLRLSMRSRIVEV